MPGGSLAHGRHPVRAMGHPAGGAVHEVEDALLTLQKLDPPGVGARDLRECLLLQLTPETPHVDLVRNLILHHLEDITHNRLPAIAFFRGLYFMPLIRFSTPNMAAICPSWCRISLTISMM